MTQAMYERDLYTSLIKKKRKKRKKKEGTDEASNGYMHTSSQSVYYEYKYLYL